MATNPQHHPPQLGTQMVKASTAATVGGSLLVIAGLTLVATVIGLTIVTPLLVLFSPVLVPAVATALLIGAGFAAAGGMGSTAAYVFYWLYKYVAGKHPMGADQLDRARSKLASAAHTLRERAEHYTTGEGA